MALFGIKTKKSAQDASSSVGKKEAPTETAVKAAPTNYAHVLRNSRITEKASDLQASSVYTFDIATSATKRDVARAMHAIYKVRPRSIRIVKVPSKNARNARTGRRGVKQGGRKAYVYLKKGETITIQ